jgi:hypothetical protein
MGMKATEIDIRQYFAPLLHTPPWKAKLGYGSFLTFDFGQRVKVNGYVHGEWHLWIYLSQWTLLHGSRELADSDSDRRVISASVRRLEGVPLSEVQFEQEQARTTFVFDDFRLMVSPADYLDDTDERDNYWLLYMPNHQILKVGPSGIGVGRSDVPDHE